MSGVGRSTVLLDASVLIPLVIAEHEHHDAVRRWLPSAPRLALCPIVEGALGRTLLRLGETPATVAAVLASLHERSGVEFWPDAVSYRDIDLARVRGHRQLTDAYLVALAASHGALLATLDRGLATLHGDAALLLDA